MIRYYNGEKLLGHLVGTCPKTGKPVLVDSNLNYFTPDVVTHQMIGNTVLDERVKRATPNKLYDPFTELPKRY